MFFETWSSDFLLKGERITVRPLREEDAYDMLLWGKHKSPLFGDYNFDDMNHRDMRAWYRRKTGKWTSRYFSVRDGNELVAYFGIKEIRWLFRRSVFGIVVNPEKVDQGYGTEIFRVFLPYYFGRAGMRRLFLEVAEFNERARHLYEKIGFRPIGQFLDWFYTDDLSEDHPDVRRNRNCFVFDDGNVYNYIIMMEINRRIYQDLLWSE